MKNHTHKFSFIVICPEANAPRVKSTINSIKKLYQGISSLVVVPDSIAQTEIDLLKEFCFVKKGGKKITSLINTGIKNGHTDWNILLMEGCKPSARTVGKIFNFIDDESNIMFPVSADRDREGKIHKTYTSFDECSLNGITIHQKTFQKIGGFSNNPLLTSKFFWQMDAIEKGCSFRGVLGMNLN